MSLWMGLRVFSFVSVRITRKEETFTLAWCEWTVFAYEEIDCVECLR